MDSERICRPKLVQAEPAQLGLAGNKEKRKTPVNRLICNSVSHTLLSIHTHVIKKYQQQNVRKTTTSLSISSVLIARITMAGVINLTPSAITTPPVWRYKKVQNSRVSYYIRSSAETPVTSKEPPQLGVSTSTPTFFCPAKFQTSPAEFSGFDFSLGHWWCCFWV